MLGMVALSLFLSWIQVGSETYIVESSAGEERATRVLKELEHFHQLYVQAWAFVQYLIHGEYAPRFEPETAKIRIVLTFLP